MKLDRCLENLPDLLAAMERETKHQDSAMPGDTDDLVEQLDDNEIELDTVPAVGVKAVGVRPHVRVLPHPCCESRKTGKNIDTPNGRKPGTALLSWVLSFFAVVVLWWEGCFLFERRCWLRESAREERRIAGEWQPSPRHQKQCLFNPQSGNPCFIIVE